MKQIYLILLFVLLGYSPLRGQSTNISGVINTYVSVLQLGSGNCIDSIYVNSTNGFNVDDTVFLFQMKGAILDTSNSSSFGSIINYNNAGNYELASIKSISANCIILNSPLRRTYFVGGALQLIRVPYYANATVVGTLTAAPWNGSTGGVLAFIVAGTLTLNASIDVSDKGFRGGLAPAGSFSCNASAYYFPVGSLDGGNKGEGIGVLSNLKKLGRGAQANGGGGGNNNNSGGGGGSNFSAGGRGGDQVLYSTCLGIPIGGEAGTALTSIQTQNKIFLGGGGGSGHQNDNNNQGIDGKNGGGIVFISANNIVGNGNSIKTNGTNNTQLPFTDGAGAGGAGGTMVLDVNNYSGLLNLELNGGDGGSINSPLYCLGVGGGGSGGVLHHKGSALPSNVNVSLIGGESGKQINPGSSCYQSNWGGANGQNGASFNNYSIPMGVQPIADAGPDHTICSGASVQLGGPPQSGLVYNWNNGIGSSSNPVVSPITTTTYILNVSQTGVCSLVDYDTVTVYVNSSPQASFTYVPNCSGVQLTFNNTSVGASGWLWNFGDGTTSVLTNPVHQFPDTGWFNVQLVVSGLGGCTDTVNQLVFVDLPQFPQASFTADTSTCSFSVQFNSNSINATNLLWNFGDGSSSVTFDPLHIYADSGLYQVSLIASNNCGTDTTILNIYVAPILLPFASFTSDTIHCSSTVSFLNTSQNSMFYIWDFGDGNSSTQFSPIYDYSQSGNYTVSLIASNACGADTIVQNLILNNFEPPVASFTVATLPCDSIVYFNNTSQNGIFSIWDFGDGGSSYLNHPIYQYSNQGNYNVTLISTNECGSDTSSIFVNIELSGPADASFTYDVGFCNSIVQFGNQSVNDYDWLWYFGDNDSSTLANPVHLYEYAGLYQVVLIVNPNSACSDTSEVQLLIEDIGITEVFIPNAFSPNNDGVNDLFELFIPEICDVFNLSIFNRWGQLVFTTSNLKNSWDGKNNGSEVPDGVYYYVLTSKLKIKQGNISVIR